MISEYVLCPKDAARQGEKTTHGGMRDQCRSIFANGAIGTDDFLPPNSSTENLFTRPAPGNSRRAWSICSSNEDRVGVRSRIAGHALHPAGIDGRLAL